MYSLKKIENASRRKEEGSERDKRHAELNSRDREKTGSRRCYEIKVAEQKQGVIRIIHHLYCIQVIWPHIENCNVLYIKMYLQVLSI